MENKKCGFASVLCVLIAGACLVACTLIFTKGIVTMKTHPANGGITATGSASCDFESNLIVWRGGFSSTAYTTEEAFASLKKDANTVKNYLTEHGVTEDELVLSAIDICTRYDSIYNEDGNYIGEEFAGYELSQMVTVSSTDVDRVEKISRDITELLSTGVQLTSNSPEYYYTELEELKLQLVEEATKNAKDRIDLMATGSGANLDSLVSSNLGVFQITATNSGDEEYSYGGTYNTSSRYKTASITVKLNYSVK